MKVKLPPEWREFLELLLSEKVDFLIVGAFSVSFYTRPRFTGDIDIFVRRDKENAARLMTALERFGFGGLGIEVEDLMRQDHIIQLGRTPRRIDILTGITAVDFDEAWATREQGHLGELEVPFISGELLLRNKRAVGREKDKDDVAELERWLARKRKEADF